MFPSKKQKIRVQVMLQRLVVRASSKKWSLRLFSSSSAVRSPRPEDEGDWFYSSEWWGKDPESDGHTVLRSTSDKGNGVVSVVAYPSSRPDAVEWKGMEKWLQKRYQKIQPENELNDPFRILGYQWRVLHFNDVTIQSAVKVMAAYRKSDPSSLFIMQQPDILAVPYVKSMATVGLTTLASCGYDLLGSAHRGKPMHILCIGHGAGSLPLFLASKIQGAIVHVVEIDPVVISASVQAMGFPAFSVMSPSGERVHTRPEMVDELLWKGTHERLFLYESDAEKFIINNTHLYDLIYIDAYDGDDIFPRKFWDTNSPFLEALKDRLHPEHGTVVVNLHSDHDNVYEDGNSPPSLFHQFLPMGRYVSQVGRAYKDGLVWNGIDFDGQGLGGLGFIVSVPWLCNTSLVVCRGFGLCDGNPDRDLVLNKLMTKSQEVEGILNLPFSCLQYLKRGFLLVD